MCSEINKSLNTVIVNKLINSYKHSARDRRIVWKLTFQDVAMIISSNCYYCGCVPNTKAYRQPIRKILESFYYIMGLIESLIYKDTQQLIPSPVVRSVIEWKMSLTVEDFLKHVLIFMNI